MKLLPLSLLAPAIAGIIAPAAVAGQQIMGLEGQKARPDPADPQVTATPTQPDYLLKTCDEVPSAGGAVTAMNMVEPIGWLVGTVLTKNSRQVTDSEFEALMTSVRLTQLQGIKHGQLISHTSSTGRVFYEYRSEPGYVGKDQAIFMAEFEGKRYKIIANVVVSMNINENDPQCPRPTLIKITKPSSGDSGFGSGYNLGSITINLADLAGGAVDQAVGNTLDTNAAGRNWKSMGKSMGSDSIDSANYFGADNFT